MEPDLVPLTVMAVEGVSRSPHWAAVRHAYAVQNPACAACGGLKLIQIHHKKPFHLHPDLELDPSNFITLCESPERLCHHRIGHSLDWKAFNPHVVDDAAISFQRIEERKYI